MRKISLLPREEEKIIIEEPADKAAGFNGIYYALKHISKKSGLFKGMKTLLNMNQQDGFDCPGCAWPDPAAKK